MTETPAWDAWSALNAEDQAEVTRLAKLGQRHPDPRVAAAAEGWAHVILDLAEEEKADRRSLVGILGSAVDVALTVFLDGGGDLQWAQNRDQRRWAKKVLAAR